MILFLSLGCINDELLFQRVELTGEIISETSDAPVYLSAHYAWFGEDVLRIPAKKFDSIELSTAGEFSWTLDVPLLEEAEGLALYAWQDLDGDGDFCGLEGTEEFSAIAPVDFPTFSAFVELSLSHSCSGSESLWEELNL